MFEKQKMGIGALILSFLASYADAGQAPKHRASAHSALEQSATNYATTSKSSYQVPATNQHFSITTQAPSKLEQTVAQSAEPVLLSGPSGTLVQYNETAPNSGIFNMTLTNTNTVDNLVNLTLDYSAISPTYVDEFIQGNPVFLSGASDATWEYVAGSSGGGVLVFQAENQLSFNYLTPGQQVAFQITHNPDYTGFAQAQAQAGTEASGNLFQNFDAPKYVTIAETPPSQPIISELGIGRENNTLLIYVNKMDTRYTNVVQRTSNILGQEWETVASFVPTQETAVVEDTLTPINHAIYRAMLDLPADAP